MLYKKLLAVNLSFLLLLYGCNAQQWFQVISALLPIVGQTYLQFYGLTQTGGVGADDIDKVQALTKQGQDLIKTVENLVSAYEKNKNASTIIQIKDVVTQLQQSVSAFLTDVQIKNSTQFARYQAYAEAILADILDIVSVIPVVVQATPVRATSVEVVIEHPNLAKAKNLVTVFKSRLAGLPK